MLRHAAVTLAALVLLSACDKLPHPMAAAGKRASVAVLDLAAVAKALGRDEVFREQMHSAREQLREQLTEFSTGLQDKLREEQARLGEAPTAEQQQDLREKLALAQRQVQQSQALARQKAAEFQTTLALAFRNEVQPVAAEIARSQGASAVVLSNTLLWFEPGVDITGKVIEAMRAQQATPPPPGATKSE